MFVKQLIEKGTKFLHVLNLANPLKASDGDGSVR
jgi:hypothetical protein